MIKYTIEDIKYVKENAVRKYRIKNVMINALFSAAGLAVGIVQFLLLNKITSALTVKKGRMAPYIAAKALLYVVFILAIYFFVSHVIFLAAGYGVGIIAGSFINFIKRL